MKLKEIADLIDAKAVCCEQKLEHEIDSAFASDLMSDVLTINNSTHVLLLTGLANIQTIRTAEMSDIQHVLLVRNKKATPQMIELAEEAGICIMQCAYSMYKTCGVLYENKVNPIY